MRPRPMQHRTGHRHAQPLALYLPDAVNDQRPPVMHMLLPDERDVGIGVDVPNG